MHWVLCEAVAAATVLAEVTGEQRYRDLAARWREHGEAALRRPGDGQLAPRAHAGRRGRAAAPGPGQPDAYHLAQMLLLDGRPVRGSVAAALR